MRLILSVKVFSYTLCSVTIAVEVCEEQWEAGAGKQVAGIEKGRGVKRCRLL
jgi:hypothetical protein